MQVITTSSTRSDLTDLVSKLQTALVPDYFESVTLTPCEGSSPTADDPSYITLTYSSTVQLKFKITQYATSDGFEIVGEGMTNVDLKLYDQNTVRTEVPFPFIYVTDNAVLLDCSYIAYDRVYLTFGKNSDGHTCVYGSINSGKFVPFSTSSYVMCIDLAAGKPVGDYYSFLPWPMGTVTTPETDKPLIMSNIPTMNGKPIVGVFRPHYTAFNSTAYGTQVVMNNKGYIVFAGSYLVVESD